MIFIPLYPYFYHIFTNPACDLFKSVNDPDLTPQVLLLCLHTPLTLVCGGGESDHPAFGPPASIYLHLASSSITPAGSFHKTRGDSGVRMWMQLKRWCVSCVLVLQRGNSGDVCDLASTLCKYDLRKGDCLF